MIPKLDLYLEGNSLILLSKYILHSSTSHSFTAKTLVVLPAPLAWASVAGSSLELP